MGFKYVAETCLEVSAIVYGLVRLLGEQKIPLRETETIKYEEPYSLSFIFFDYYCWTKSSNGTKGFTSGYSLYPVKIDVDRFVPRKN